jgi:signal transduction histidine kinase
VEATAYYVIAEALTNVAKYAEATEAWVSVAPGEEDVHVEIGDDGVGGADLRLGTGLRGLADRVEALRGTLTLQSPPGAGTTVSVRIPLAQPPSP